MMNIKRIESTVKGWTTEMASGGNEVHVIPQNDSMAHETSDECACLPRTESVEDDEGRVCGFLITHNSWDGRR